MRALLLLLAACASNPPAPTVVVVQKDPAKAAAPAAAAVEDAPCQADADCGFTRVGVGERVCCPLLCTPRIVTKKRAQELEERIPACNGGRECPLPACRAPREHVMAACV